MGLFNVVYHLCDCGEYVEWQSKEGSTECHHFATSQVPKEIAKDLEGTFKYCSGCNKGYQLKVVMDTDVVQMEATEE